MTFINPLQLFLLAQICFERLMLFSVSICLIFVASTECKIGLHPSMAKETTTPLYGESQEPLDCFLFWPILGLSSAAHERVTAI